MRERVGRGEGRGNREKGESQGPKGVEVRGERLGGIGALWSLRACLDLSH